MFNQFIYRRPRKSVDPITLPDKPNRENYSDTNAYIEACKKFNELLTAKIYQERKRKFEETKVIFPFIYKIKKQFYFF